MKDPVISVVMPVYNGEKYLKECIDSILKQTFTNFEFIIVNDGSTDKTEEIILAHKDNRIVYLKNETNLKIVKSLNKGISVSRGVYIARMDADDISLPSRFERQIQFMDANQNVDVCGSWAETIEKRSRILKMPVTCMEIKLQMLSGPALIHPSVLGKKSFFINFQYRDDYIAAEDYDLWVRGIDNFCYANIPSILFRYRVHGGQTDKVNGTMQRNVVNQIRGRYLKRFFLNINDRDVFLFNRIMNKEFKGREDALELFHKILNDNKDNNFFPHKELKDYMTYSFYRAMHGSFLNRVFQKKRKIIYYLSGLVN